MRSFKDETAKADQGLGMGTFITQPSYAGRVWRPKWSKAEELRAETHVRFTGPVNDDQTNFMPWRYGPEDNEFGGWIVRVPIFIGGTTSPISFVAASPDPDKPGEWLDVDMYPSPAAEFHTHAMKMAKADPVLKVKLLDGAMGRAAALPKRIQSLGLAQGVLLQWGSKNYYKSPQFPVVFFMSYGALTSLCDVLNTKVDGYRGDPLDFTARFSCGDVLDASNGRVFAFYNALSGTVQQGQTGNVEWGNNGGNTGHRQQKELPRYACDIRGKLPLLDKSGKIMAPGGKPMFTPWDKVIRLMNDKEQVDLLCRAFADQPGLLRDCLRKYSNLLPAYVRGDAQVVTPGPVTQATQAAQAPTAQAPTAPDPEVANVDWGGVGVDDVQDTEQNLADAISVGMTAAGAAAPAPAPAATVAAGGNAKVSDAMSKLAELRKGIKK